MPEKSARIARWKRHGWRALLGVVAASALVMLVLNPELAALGFLFDPIVLDVAILFFGTQLVLFKDQIRIVVSGCCSSVVQWWKALRPKR